MKKNFHRHAPVMFEECVASTNTRLKALAVEGVEHGTVLVASRQTGGRGRRGKSFESPSKGLYMSMLLRPEGEPEKNVTLTACAAVAVAEAVERICGVKPEIKWPNDLILKGKKICGILAEQVFDGKSVQLVLGIGLNVNTAEEDFSGELRGTAGSILTQTGKETSIEQLAVCVIAELDKMYELWCRDSSMFLEEYRRNCVNLGKEVNILRDGKTIPAYVQKINDDYSLEVRYENGELDNIYFGEVSIRNK